MMAGVDVSKQKKKQKLNIKRIDIQTRNIKSLTINSKCMREKQW